MSLRYINVICVCTSRFVETETPVGLGEGGCISLGMLRKQSHRASGGAVDAREESASASGSVICILRGVVRFQQCSYYLSAIGKAFTTVFSDSFWKSQEDDCLLGKKKDEFGKQLLEAGVEKATIDSWSNDPQVTPSGLPFDL